MQPVTLTDPASLYHNGIDGLQHDTIFNEKFERHLGKAYNFALETLGKPRENILGRADDRPARCCSSLGAVSLSPSYGSSSSYGTHNTFINQTSNTFINSGYGYGNGNNDTTALLLGILAILAGAAKLGYCFANYQNTQDEIVRKENFEKDLSRYQISPEHRIPHQQLEQIKGIFQEYTQLLNDSLSRDRLNCFTAVAILSGGAVLAIGGAVSSTGLMMLGGAALVSVTAATLFRVIYECQRTSRIPEHAQNIVDAYNGMKQRIYPNLI